MALNLENIDLGEFGTSEEDDTQPELNTQVRANMDEALKVNPDEHANVTNLSQQSDIPEFAVQSDPAKVEHELKLDNIDFGQMSKRNPNTEKYLTDFNNSVIAQDDVDVLQSIEDIFDFGKTFENIGESITTGFSSQGKGFLLAGADMTPERIQDLIPSGAMPIGMESEAQLMSAQFAESLGITTDEQLQTAKKESTDKLLTELRELQEKRKQLTPEDLNLLEQGVRAGVESLANMAPGTALMLLSGGRAAPLLATIGVQTFSGSYGEGRAEGLTPQEAGWFASIDAAIEVGTELLPTGTIERMLTGESTGLKKEALKFMVQEMGTEQLATLGQSINSFLFGLDEEMEKAETTEEMVNIQLRRQAVTAIATVVAGGAQITAATGLRKGIEALTQDENKKETQGQVEQQKIDKLNEQAEKSKLRERDKESFKQFVNEADGENNTNVFIDGTQTSLYLQNKTREEIEADPALKLLNEQAREARELGTDVQVPVADFAAEIAGTDHYAELRDSMTMSDETTSPFRQEQVKQETETYVRNLMEEAQENTSEYVEAQEIYTQVRDQLIDTGAVTPANASIMAQIVPAWATAQATRQGKTVQQVYQDSGLTIEGPATGERARLEGEMILTQEPAYKEAPEIFDSVRDEFLNVLPEDATVEDVNEAITEFSPEYKNFIKALERDDWLGFDFPSQAINAALSEEIEQFEVSKGLKQSIGKMVNKAFGVATVEQRATLLEQPLVERRKITGSKARTLFDKMNREQLIDELLKHELTGIKGRKAFVVDVQDAPAVASIDADSLKWINDNLSPDHGDALLQAVADALESETEGAYHISGDEFYIIGETQDEVQAAVNNAIDKLKTVVIEATKPDGTVITLNGLNITHGVGESKDVADQKLKQEKVRREEIGERAPRGEQPLGSIIRSPEGFDPDGEISEVGVPEDGKIPKREDGDIGRRPESGSDQALIEEAKGRTDEQALSEFQRAERGEEVTVIHRAHDAISKLNDEKLDEVISKKTPSAYFGHYLGTADVGNAQRHGNDVTVHKVQLKNPLIISAEAFESVTDGMTHEEAIAKREFFKTEGHDGILVRGLNWVIAFESDILTELQEEFGDVGEMFAQEGVDERDLVNVHNLSAENILVAEELGGLAAPSLATVRTGVSDFTGFGEISLLAKPEFLQDPKARTFDADIYSPRQPRPVYDINFDAYKAFERQLDPDNLGLSTPDIQSLEDTTGADNLQRSTAVEYYWLQSQNKAPKLKKAKVDPIVKKAEKLGLSHVAMMDDSKFAEMVTKHYQKVLDDLTAEGFDVRVEKMKEWYFDEDGVILHSKIFDMASSVIRHRESGGFDVHQLRDDISKKMRVKKTRNEYNQWVTDKFNSMVTSKKLFKGFTPSGNRKYVDYNLQNVVKEMTQQLQAGEGFFYGAGTVRSAYANEMKTIKQLQAKREEIVSEEDMTKIKEESADVFSDALDKLKPFYKFEADSFHYSDDAGNAIVEGRKGLNETFNMTEEAQQIVDDLTEYLSALPTEYFETKFKRPVQFSEFDTAVVPRGTRKDALQVLKDAGLKIKTYNPKDKGSRAEVIAKQQRLLFQKGKEKEARGYYDPANSIIRLTEAADLSTFLHEFAHFMYEMEVNGDTEILQSINGWYKRNAEDVAKEANTYLGDESDVLIQGKEPTIKEGSITPDDVVTFLDNNTTGVKDKDAAIRRAVHEQFARGFETYLMEGKAPSIELRNAFRAFARWLSRIYQALRGQLDVKIDAEMRQVFDRLLATEEQITAAEARARVEPMFTDAALAGMTEEEFADYQKRQEKVRDIQSETLRDKIIKQLTRQTKQWWKEEKQDIIDEEMESLNKQQVYSTRTRLKDGDIKLDHATVKEMAGEEKEDKLGRKSVVVPPELRGMTAKGQQGVHPDEAAAFFGYKSGSEMLHDLTTAPAIKVQAESNAEALMVDRHGDILTDGTIEQQADEAVRNEERGKLILSELKTLAKGTNAPTIERNTIKDLAETNIGKLSFREIHPGKYRKAEIRAAQESAAMLAAGNREGAASAKMRQVMNYYLGMTATNAKNDTVKIVDRMARYNKKKVREEIMKAEGGYWDQIVRILNRFEFRKAATLKEIESLNLWMAERNNEAGDALVLTNAVLNESYVTHWKNVPFSDLQGINDSMKNIEHVARYANKLTRMQEEIDFNKLVDRWITSMDEKVKTRFVSKRADVAEGRKWGRWFMAQMTKIPMMASWLDGGERTGISHQIMVQPFTDAYNAEIKLWTEAGKPVMDAIENRSKADRKRHNQKNYIPEIDDNLYGHQILAVALNTGNQSNLKKMLLGEGWANPEVETEIEFNNPKLQAVLSHMTKDDWVLVQNIWDQMETLYPQLAEVHRRTTGLTPPKIEAVPVETEFGTFRGGYYPVKYDPNRDQRAALNEDKLNAETESMFSNNASIQASVNTGATNERTGYYAPIRLSIDVVPAHFQETIHYITHHDAVREVNRLTRNKQVAQTIKEKLGPEEYAQLRPWLNDIAKDGREAPTKMFWDDMLQKLRFGVTLGTMGFKASTGIIQVSGLSNSVAEVGLGNMMQSMRSILGSTTTIKQAWDFAVENSQVMEHRAQTMDREIKNAMKRIEGKRGILAAAQEASMKHIALIQTYMVDLPSWHAAYIKGMQDWGDEARSFQYADWVIENVQGSGATKDMARIMRSQAETGRMFTMFMTFFSSLWNMERDLVKGAKTGRYSTTNVAAKVMFLFTIPVLFEMMMRGQLGEPEGEDDRLQRMLTGVAMYPIQSIPFIRDIASAAAGEFGYNISPLQSIIEQGTRTLPELITRGFTDDEITKGQVKGATKFIGATLGIPGMNQAWATGEHLYDVIEEGEEFTTRELLFGPDRE